jgi:hypothetical protein
MLFIFFAAGQLRGLVRPKKPPEAVAPRRAPAVASFSPADPVLQEIPKGTRYQVLRTLRAMARGQFMVVAHKIPDVRQDDVDHPNARETFFKSLRSAASWQAHTDVEPVLVPGTTCPWVIGRIMIRSGWCAPSDQPHWVPNLRFFFLNDLGREALEKAQAWWSQLTTLERVRVMVFE